MGACRRCWVDVFGCSTKPIEFTMAEDWRKPCPTMQMKRRGKDGKCSCHGDQMWPVTLNIVTLLGSMVQNLPLHSPWNFEWKLQKVNGRSSSTSSWDFRVLPGPFCSRLFCRGSNGGNRSSLAQFHKIEKTAKPFQVSHYFSWAQWTHKLILSFSYLIHTSQGFPRCKLNLDTFSCCLCRSFGRWTKTPFLRNSGLFIFLKCRQSKERFSVSSFKTCLVACCLALPCLIAWLLSIN